MTYDDKIMKKYFCKVEAICKDTQVKENVKLSMERKLAPIKSHMALVKDRQAIPTMSPHVFIS